MTLRKPKGFSLLELALLLVVIGILVTIASAVVIKAINQSTSATTNNALLQTEQALLGRLHLNRSLACADTDADGLGNCPARIGTVPYIDLGMDSMPVDGNGMALTYIANGYLFAPTANAYDFCQTLLTVASTVDLGELYGAGNASLAYAIFSGGKQDILNNSSANDTAIIKAGSAGYSIEENISDDRYRSKSNMSLLGKFNCPATLLAINAMETELIAGNLTRTTLDFIKTDIEGRIKGSELAIVMASLSVATAAASVVGAAATAIDAGAQAIFFGNAAAVVLAPLSVVAAGLAVVAAGLSIVEIVLEADAIVTFNTIKDHVDRQRTFVAATCTGLSGEIVSAKGGATPCN